MCKLVTELKVVYKDARLYRYTDSLLKIAESQVSELKVRVSLLDEKEIEVKNNYERQILNLNSQITLLKEQVVGFEKLVKRERRRLFWAKTLGGFATAAAIVVPLLINK